MGIVKTPSGFYPLTGELANTLNSKQNDLLSLYKNEGFDLVICPIVNFASSNTSFKFSDNLSQNDLEIIDDLTPQVSNIDSTNTGIKKYCYAQNIVKSKPDDFYSSRSPLQVGAEIYGDDSSCADSEIINIMIKSLKSLGISDISIVLGNIAIFNEIIRSLGITEHALELKNIFAAKSIPDLEAFIAKYNISSSLLTYLSSGETKDFNCEAITPELTTINRVKDSITDTQVVVDITDTKTYDYHNGIIFSAYAPSYPKAIARGGRFVSEFGRTGTGFSFDLQFLLQH